MVQDQSSHLDHDRFGLLMWLNLMAASAFLGMYLYSAGAIHFVKMLEYDGVYEKFCAQFDSVKSLRDPTKLLKDSFLKGSSSHPLSAVFHEPLLLTHRFRCLARRETGHRVGQLRAAKVARSRFHKDMGTGLRGGS